MTDSLNNVRTLTAKDYARKLDANDVAAKMFEIMVRSENADHPLMFPDYWEQAVNEIINMQRARARSAQLESLLGDNQNLSCLLKPQAG
jgi:hypothetical protein